MGRLRENRPDSDAYLPCPSIPNARWGTQTISCAWTMQLYFSCMSVILKQSVKAAVSAFHLHIFSWSGLVLHNHKIRGFQHCLFHLFPAWLSLLRPVKKWLPKPLPSLCSSPHPDLATALVRALLGYSANVSNTLILFPAPLTTCPPQSVPSLWGFHLFSVNPPNAIQCL